MDNEVFYEKIEFRKCEEEGCRKNAEYILSLNRGQKKMWVCGMHFHYKYAPLKPKELKARPIEEALPTVQSSAWMGISTCSNFMTPEQKEERKQKARDINTNIGQEASYVKAMELNARMRILKGEKFPEVKTSRGDNMFLIDETYLYLNGRIYGEIDSKGKITYYVMDI